MIKKTVSSLVTIVWFCSCWAQTVTKVDFQPQRAAVKTYERVTAIALRSASFEGPFVKVVLNGEELEIPLDPDAPDFTYFLSLSSPLSGAHIDSPTDARFNLFLINSGSVPTIPKPPQDLRTDQDSCLFPFSAVPQSQWRAGLSSPNYSRSFTEVQHVVVHHSAGSNTNTNYTQVVRDIYLLHTQVNGWSDIGYNYLIAQDGTIYAGRDPGSDGAQDDVLGAHFCGANSFTMGICLLGDYEVAVPSVDAWLSLSQVTAHKLNKEGIDPWTRYQHPLGSLRGIIGHRDGCSTLCPGQHVYEHLDDLRETTADLIDACDGTAVALLDFAVSNRNPEVGEEVILANKSTGYSHFQWTLEGGVPDTAYWIGDGMVKYFLPGEYDITLIGFADYGTDTLSMKNAIAVKSNPVVYPNPVSHSTRTIYVASYEAPLEVILYGVSGRIYDLKAIGEHAYLIPVIPVGVYMIQVTTAFKAYRAKLIVR